MPLLRALDGGACIVTRYYKRCELLLTLAGLRTFSSR